MTQKIMVDTIQDQQNLSSAEGIKRFVSAANFIDVIQERLTEATGCSSNIHSLCVL